MMNSFLKDETLAKLPTDERIKALERIIPRADVDEVLAETGHGQAFYKRLLYKSMCYKNHRTDGSFCSKFK